MKERNPRSIVLGALIVAVVLGSGALLARGVASLTQLGTPPRSEAGAALSPAQRIPAAPPIAHPQQIGEQVLARNIFDSDTGTLPWELPKAAGESGSSDATESDGGIGSIGERCGGDLRLLASVVHRDPSRSLAALRKEGKTHFLRLGERSGELELVALQPTEAFFRNGAGVCSLPVYVSANGVAPSPPPALPVEPEPAKASEPSEAAIAAKKRPPAFSEEELKRNIRVLGPARYAVTRELFTRARMNPSGISRGARFKPELKDGRSAGMNVFKLRDDSLLAHLGVKQGDVLRGLNGFQLGSADGVMEAMGHLGKKNQVSLSIERGGALHTIEYVLE